MTTTDKPRAYTSEELDEMVAAEVKTWPRIKEGSERWHELRRLLLPTADRLRAEAVEAARRSA